MLEAATQPLAFSSEGHQLSGTLHLPSGAGPVAAITVVHGASGGHRDYPIYLHLARVMNEIGVAVFIYDRRGEQLPPDQRIHPGYMALGRDAIAAAHVLQQHPAIDPTRLGLWGLSQGGWVAPAAFAQAPATFAFMILVSSCGVGPDAQMEHAVAHTLRAAGYGDQTAQTAAALRRDVHRFYRGELPRERVQAGLDRYQDEAWFPHTYLGKSLPADPTRSGWYNEIQFRPEQTFRQVTAPLLLLYGDDDPWIPLDKSIAVWRAALAAAGNTAFEIHRLPQTGHSMIAGEAPLAAPAQASPPQFSPRYTSLMQAFVRRQL